MSSAPSLRSPQMARAVGISAAFTQVGGQPRTNLAQVDATGAVTGFAPQPNAAVTALRARPDGGVFGGDFTTFAGVPASRLVAVDAAGATVWTGTVAGGPIRAPALSSDGTRLYLGGDFSTVNGVDRKRFAAVDAVTGVVATQFAPGTVNLAVYDIAVQGTSVLLAGDFTKVNAVRGTDLPGSTEQRALSMPCP